MSLLERYKQDCERRSDINEHLATIYKYACECESIVELGAGRTSESLLTLAAALLTSAPEKRQLHFFSADPFNVGEIAQLCALEDVPLHLRRENIFNMKFDKEIDMCFIDSDHIFAQMRAELEKFGLLTKKYIICHDTTIDRDLSSLVRMGQNVKEFAAKYGLKRLECERGIRPAIDKFLAANPQWKILKEFENNNGLLILTKT